MYVKDLVEEDFNHYKTCSMVVAFPTCSWKCGKDLCQNSALAKKEGFQITFEEIANQYMRNPLSNSIVCAGLEPFDDFEDLADLICTLRNATSDPIVIYTGYDENEVKEDIDYLAIRYNHLIVKFGRYIPNEQKHYDNILGIELSSQNQYGKVIS